MDTVGDQDAGSQERVARLAWRLEVLSVASQYLAVKLADRDPLSLDPSDCTGEASHAFDIGLIAASGLFDADFYLTTNQDVARAKLDPLEHYLRYGGLEGRWPCPFFDGGAYLASYEDLRKAGANPLLHYLKFGIVEGRTAGAPNRHPAARRLTDIMGRADSLEASALAEIYASLPEPGCYAAAMDSKAVAEIREVERSTASMVRASDMDRDTAYSDEIERLRTAREDAELRLYVANAALQRAVARNEALLVAQQESEREKEVLRQERDNAVAQPSIAESAAASVWRREAVQGTSCLAAGQSQTVPEDIELRLYVANASLQRAFSRNETLLAALQESEQEKEALRQQRDDSAARLRSAEVTLARAADLEGATRGTRQNNPLLWAEMKRGDEQGLMLEGELATAPSQLATTASELAFAARELILTGRELQRLQREEGDRLHARAERDALRLHAATLEHDLQHGREQEAAFIASRLELLAEELSNLRRGIEAKPDAGSLTARTLYLDLLETTLLELLTNNENAASREGSILDPEQRVIGRGGPREAVPTIGTARMRNIRRLLDTALDDGIEGDVLEAGVWQGGTCIYMRGIFAARGISDRKVWAVDLFSGLPRPDTERHPADQGNGHHAVQERVTSLESVRGNFERFGLLDDRVVFLSGRFKDTLPKASIERLAVLRLAVDMYDSTMETLEALYAKVSPGGFVIIDDYSLKNCRAAVDDYRAKNKISEPISRVDGAAIYWQKAK